MSDSDITELHLPYEHCTVSLGHGWSCYDMLCAVCGHEWVIVAPLGTQGYDCPACGYHGQHVRLGNVESDHATDGAWLTGVSELPGGVMVYQTGIWSMRTHLEPLKPRVIHLGKRARRRLWGNYDA